MDDELTKNKLETSDNRIACSDAPSGLLDTPQRMTDSGHQGARSESALVGSFSPTTVVAVRTGGASQSKWTRETRPWNAIPETAVVDSNAVRDPQPLGSNRFQTDNHDCRRRSPRRSPISQGRRRTQGVLREILAARLPERAAASTAPSLDVRSGEGVRALRGRRE